MNIVIVGPGSIGSLWAYHFHEAGHNVSVWLRQVKSKFCLRLDNHPELTFKHNNLEALANADLVLITTKVWQVNNAIRPLLSKLSPETIIVLMHNGMGGVEELSDNLSSFPLLISTTTHGAKKTSPFQVLHTGKGCTQVGALNSKGDQCEFVADVFHHALPESLWNKNISNALWLKLIINCAINPLTAIEQCKNGELNNDRFTSVIHNLINESITVAQAEGFTFKFDDIESQIYRVISATAENFSSMHQDICNQRKTEIDYITGYLLKCAHKHQISVPENQRLYQIVKQMERRKKT